ncbi:hypothetical protein [Nitrospira sp. BLG_2]|uniref:hypothetical protein n=1 Tax=Nitrospira sp. BLG_2 TaxID=3397507 RepID=UPI003B98ED95
MERYTIFMIRSGSLFWWTGRKWDLRPYNVKCYGTRKAAEHASKTASKKADEPVSVVEGVLEAPK